MIIAKIEAFKSNLDKLKQLETSQKKKDDISATLQALENIAIALKKFITLYNLIRHRLTSETNKAVNLKIKCVIDDVNTSKQAFHVQQRQVKQLQEIKKEVDKLTKDVEAAWKIYAAGQVNPQLGLLQLVGHLPEVSRQFGNLNKLQQELEILTYEVPKIASDIEGFDQKIDMIARSLSALQLKPVIKSFLDKVLGGKATLADLDDDISTWCQQEDRAKAFKITFK